MDKLSNYISEIERLNKTINDNLNVERLKDNGIQIKNNKRIQKNIKSSIKRKLELQERFRKINHIDEIEREIEKMIDDRNRLYKKCEQLKHKLKTKGIVDKKRNNATIY